MKELKRIFFICILFIIIVSYLQSQNIDKKTVQQIMNEFDLLYDKKSIFRRDNIDFNGYSSQGGILYSYYNGSILQFLTLYLYSERGKTELRIYPIEKKLIFLTKIESFYEGSIFEEPVNISRKEEKNFIIEDKTEYDVTSDIKIIDTNYLIELITKIFQTIK